MQLLWSWATDPRVGGSIPTCAMLFMQVKLTVLHQFLPKICDELLLCRIYAISVKLSPEKSSSGIKCLEANNFKIYCFQTLTGEEK